MRCSLPKMISRLFRDNKRVDFPIEKEGVHMSEITRTMSEACSGIVRIAFLKDDKQVGTGTGFLSHKYLITNSHVIRPPEVFDAVQMTFGDQDINPITPIRYLPDDFYSFVLKESPKDERDYSILRINESEFCDRYQFTFCSSDDVSIGEQVVFFGFPFGTEHLTSHVGYLSSIFKHNSIKRLQIDGSINPGNSGGPLVHLESGEVIGIVTKTQTGLDKDFEELTEAVKGNVKSLEQTKTIMRVGGIDPIQASRVTMQILQRIAENIKRSANVGIGYAYDSSYALEALGELGET